MNDQVLEAYREAGRVASRILREGTAMVRVDGSILDVVEAVEARVREAGAGLAFPLNLSLNEDAAHDTATPGDPRVFQKGDMVKLDLGVQLDGYIADTAATVDLGNSPLLVEASREALEAAIARVRPGVTTGELGAVIQQEIEGRGYRPVVNLTGHGLERYRIHAPPTIPNIAIQGGAVLQEGMAFAIEPFASTGTGMVSDTPRIQIFQQVAEKPVRMPAAREILVQVRDRNGLPFARRWLDGSRVEIGLATLVRASILHAYPVLHDRPGSLVSQAEHTLIVTAEGALVTTR
ncbi:MAG: type II methionyl aminopeptidase [Methanomicrobiales archaeon]|nr:type II methionyl aminopeptidase [Methanomicrobiales archaeon]MDD1659652.1 type II methionyl aminopeptidase [Methanomicrobiales archaeon]